MVSDRVKIAIIPIHFLNYISKPCKCNLKKAWIYKISQPCFVICPFTVSSICSQNNRTLVTTDDASTHMAATNANANTVLFWTLRDNIVLVSYLLGLRLTIVTPYGKQ